jgi:release factor glutamine methyltransferase
MLLESLIKRFHSELKELYDEGEVKSLTRNALMFALNLTSVELFVKKKEKLSEDATEKTIQILNRLKKFEPLQYIIGETEFNGLKIAVNKNVLIPRPETEELVEWIGTEIKNKNPVSILDIGTGSGCIAIALKKKFPASIVYAVDISKEALALARNNAKRNNAEIYFIQQDILKKLPETLKLPFDFIISNPPYLTLHDKQKLNRNVSEYEPHEALFVNGKNPFLFYERILDLACMGLIKKNGALYFEINEMYGKEIAQLFLEKGFYDVNIRNDMSGKERMICGVMA